MILRSMRLRVSLTLALTCVALGSCSSEGGATGTGSASCAAAVVYKDATYLEHRKVKREPATSGRLVEALLPSCDDSGAQEPVEPDRRVEVAELEQVPLETAFLWDGSVYLRSGRELPAATEAWFRAPGCTSAGEFDLEGDWLAVTGAKRPRFDGDLRPPYRLEMRVTDGPREYVGTMVQVHADDATDPGLDTRDVKSSLWTGGRILAHVSCVERRFHADALRTPR